LLIGFKVQGSRFRAKGKRFRVNGLSLEDLMEN